MAQRLRDVMSTSVTTCPSSTTLQEAARMMRDQGIGDVLLADGDQLKGIVTDRDIVIRGIAEGRSMDTSIGDLATLDLETLSPDDDVTKAAEVMRRRNIRRLPVTEGGRAVGIVSLGDLAIERDERSALADISATPPQT